MLDAHCIQIAMPAAAASLPHFYCRDNLSIDAALSRSERKQVKHDLTSSRLANSFACRRGEIIMLGMLTLVVMG